MLLQPEQFFFFVRSGSVPGERTVCADYPVTWNDERDRIMVYGTADCPG